MAFIVRRPPQAFRAVSRQARRAVRAVPVAAGACATVAAEPVGPEALKPDDAHSTPTLSSRIASPLSQLFGRVAQRENLLRDSRGAREELVETLAHLFDVGANDG